MAISASSDLGLLLNEAAATLDQAGVPSARLDASLLIGHVLGIDSARVRLGGPFAIDEAQRRRLSQLIRRRVKREPVSRILSEREFWSLNFQVGRATLDPRPDSETLVEAVLARLPADRVATLTDLGTGTGCLLLSILSERSQATGTGLDRSRGAVRIARLNAERLGLSDRARIVAGSWTSRKLAAADVVISNPPYINSADIPGLEPEVQFDPTLALDGGADGLDAYRAIIERLPLLVKPGGFVAFEIGNEQGASVVRLLRAAARRVEPVIRDLAGHDRVVIGYF